jgi:hypothetical protein
LLDGLALNKHDRTWIYIRRARWAGIGVESQPDALHHCAGELPGRGYLSHDAQRGAGGASDDAGLQAVMARLPQFTTAG